MMEVFQFGYKPEGYEGPAISIDNYTYEGSFPENLPDGTPIFSYRVVYYGWHEAGHMQGGKPVFRMGNKATADYYANKGPYDDGR